MTQGISPEADNNNHDVSEDNDGIMDLEPESNIDPFTATLIDECVNEDDWASDDDSDTPIDQADITEECEFGPLDTIIDDSS